jgi:hypothetical protein
MERQTIRMIREAVEQGRLPSVFGSSQVNSILGIGWAGVFLPKHRVGNPGGQTELFIRIDKGLYKLRD